MLFLAVNVFCTDPAVASADGDLVRQVVAALTRHDGSHIGLSLVRREDSDGTLRMMPMDVSAWNGRTGLTIAGTPMLPAPCRGPVRVMDTFLLALPAGTDARALFSEYFGAEVPARIPITAPYPTVGRMVWDACAYSMGLAGSCDAAHERVLSGGEPIQCAQYVTLVLLRYTDIVRNGAARNELLHELRESLRLGCALRPGRLAAVLRTLSTRADSCVCAVDPNAVLFAVGGQLCPLTTLTLPCPSDTSVPVAAQVAAF